MSTEKGKRQRRRSTRRRASTTPAAEESLPVDGAAESSHEAAREHYRREKERRATRARPPEHPLEQAKRAYHALLAADAERAKGGRPRKSGAPPARKPKGAAPDAESEE
ncbi:MAG TPA: hypothetical protein VG868_08910 [Casimicrobiaceae bacterium]|nr:hypothetical protein [Casimicrobiaceae bacterium]